MALTETQKTYHREWMRKYRQNSVVRSKDKERTQKWQKANPLVHGWYNDRRSAAKRKHEWTLSQENYNLIRAQNCSYCGLEPNPLHGIDRLDNTKGYTEKNSVAACATCNFAKRKMTVYEFLAWARRLVKHNGE